jgi:hypothetical protein
LISVEIRPQNKIVPAAQDLNMTVVQNFQFGDKPLDELRLTAKQVDRHAISVGKR